MSVVLEPLELHFKRPFNREVSQTLKLSNPHSEPVAFKVKTTAPKQYCVRPNSGRIDPGGDVEVQVLLQAMKEDPAPDAKCRDKFLVQSVAVSADKEFSNWSLIEQTNKAAIKEMKIRVAFISADASTPAPKTNGVSHAEETPSQRSPSPDAVTPHHTAPDHGTSVSSSRSLVPESPVSSFSNAVPTSGEDVQAQLTTAKEKIAQLTKQITEQSELRRRKGAEVLEQKGFPNAAQALAHPTTTGVPLQWTAGLVFLAFILGWLFF